MSTSLLAFVAEFLGLGNVGTTAQNRGQCVGIVEEWIADNNHPAIWGNAIDLPLNADRAHYAVIQNMPTNYPAPGDIVCWGSSWGGGYGHTGIVLAANDSLLAVLEQNNPEGGHCTVATHDYSGVEGWIVLK